MAKGFHNREKEGLRGTDLWLVCSDVIRGWRRFLEIEIYERATDWQNAVLQIVDLGSVDVYTHNLVAYIG